MSGPGPAHWAPGRQQAALDVSAALEMLRRLWGDEYMFGHDPEHGYWVIKDGSIGSLLKAPSPEDLNQALTGREEGAGS